MSFQSCKWPGVFSMLRLRDLDSYLLIHYRMFSVWDTKGETQKVFRMVLGKIFNSGSHLGFSIIFSTGSYLLHSHSDAKKRENEDKRNKINSKIKDLYGPIVGNRILHRIGAEKFVEIATNFWLSIPVKDPPYELSKITISYHLKLSSLESVKKGMPKNSKIGEGFISKC